MSFKFENLNVWNKALDLSIRVNDMAKTFPSIELYNLSNQIRRASDSVVLNIAEGCTGQSNPELSRFLGYALRSAIEVVSCLFIAKRKLYIDQAVFQKLYSEYEDLTKMITRFRESLTK